MWVFRNQCMRKQECTIYQYHMKNAIYGWIISDFKTINDTITILESVILKCNSVVKHHVLTGIYSNTANNIK